MIGEAVEEGVTIDHLTSRGTNVGFNNGFGSGFVGFGQVPASFDPVMGQVFFNYAQNSNTGFGLVPSSGTQGTPGGTTGTGTIDTGTGTNTGLTFPTYTIPMYTIPTYTNPTAGL